MGNILIKASMPPLTRRYLNNLCVLLFLGQQTLHTTVLKCIMGHHLASGKKKIPKRGGRFSFCGAHVAVEDAQTETEAKRCNNSPFLLTHADPQEVTETKLRGSHKTEQCSHLFQCKTDSGERPNQNRTTFRLNQMLKQLEIAAG